MLKLLFIFALIAGSSFACMKLIVPFTKIVLQYKKTSVMILTSVVIAVLTIALFA